MIISNVPLINSIYKILRTTSELKKLSHNVFRITRSVHFEKKTTKRMACAHRAGLARLLQLNKGTMYREERDNTVILNMLPQ